MKGLNFIGGAVCLAGKDGSSAVSEARLLLLAVGGAVGVTQAPVTPSFDFSACKQFQASPSWCCIQDPRCV